jgi:hypothetical protein
MMLLLAACLGCSTAAPKCELERRCDDEAATADQVSLVEVDDLLEVYEALSGREWVGAATCDDGAPRSLTVSYDAVSRDRVFVSELVVNGGVPPDGCGESCGWAHADTPARVAGAVDVDDVLRVDFDGWTHRFSLRAEQGGVAATFGADWDDEVPDGTLSGDGWSCRISFSP